MMTTWISSLGKGNAKANLSWRAASNIDHTVSSECEEKTKIKVSHHGENSDMNIRAFQTAHKIFQSLWLFVQERFSKILQYYFTEEYVPLSLSY
jgi:hypothetical protein